MAFRLNHHISEKTALENETIILNMLAELSDKKYTVISFTDSNLKFETNSWALGWNFSPVTLDGGEFNLTVSGQETLVILNYYDGFLPRIVMITFLTICLISDHQYEGILFFSAFFLITGIIHHFILKNKAKELLWNILNDREQDSDLE